MLIVFVCFTRAQVIPKNMLTYRILFRALASIADTDKLLFHWQQLSGHPDLQPDVRILNHVLYGFLRKGDFVGALRWFWDKIHQIPPNWCTFALLLDGSAVHNEGQDFRALFSAMKIFKVSLDEVAHKLLVPARPGVALPTTTATSSSSFKMTRTTKTKTSTIIAHESERSLVLDHISIHGNGSSNNITNIKNSNNNYDYNIWFQFHVDEWSYNCASKFFAHLRRIHEKLQQERFVPVIEEWEAVVQSKASGADNVSELMLQYLQKNDTVKQRRG